MNKNVKSPNENKEKSQSSILSKELDAEQLKIFLAAASKWIFVMLGCGLIIHDWPFCGFILIYMTLTD